MCNRRKDSDQPLNDSMVDTLSENEVMQARLSTGNWFTAKCELLCDEEKGKFPDIEKLKRYRNFNPYNVKQTPKKDSVIISFEFIADCCMDFVGGAQIKQDTLILEYQPPNDSLSVGCDCYCDYKMIYRLNRKNKAWSDIKTYYLSGSFSEASGD